MIQELLAGDADSVGRLLMTYRNYLRFMAGLQIDRRLRGKIDPSDLVQETMLHAQQQITKFRGNSEKELMAWLRRVLATQLAQQLRRYSAQKRDLDLEESVRRELNESSIDLERHFAATNLSPSEDAMKRERATLIADAIASLPAHYREVVLLRNFEHLGFNVIAKQMGRSTDATKKLWVRAIQRLRNELTSPHESN